MALAEFRADLHIHTCLSPCAEDYMRPSAIIAAAKKKRLHIIGICDHNSAENFQAVKKAGVREGMQVLGGMEITSCEEVHIVGLFDDGEKLHKVEEAVSTHLHGQNNENAFGKQLVVNERDEIIGQNSKLLIGATAFSVNEIVKLIHDLNGIAIAAHVDREAFGIIGQLGVIPADVRFEALELSARCSESEKISYQKYGLPLVCSSDAHCIADIGKVYTTLVLQDCSFEEVKLAFRKSKGRTLRILGPE